MEDGAFVRNAGKISNWVIMNMIERVDGGADVRLVFFDADKYELVEKKVDE